MKARLAFLVVPAIAIIVIVSACEKNPTSSYEPEVVNTLDNFHFRIDDVSNHDTSLTYYWRTDGTSANINQIASITGGRASLRIVDWDSIVTYETDFTQNGDFRSGSGLAGHWKITVLLVDFSGLIDFRVQRR